MCLAKDRYTLIEQSSNSRITCMQYSQKNFMRIIGNDQKNNGQDFWEILERIIGKISSIIGAGLIPIATPVAITSESNDAFSVVGHHHEVLSALPQEENMPNNERDESISQVSKPDMAENGELRYIYFQVFGEICSYSSNIL